MLSFADLRARLRSPRPEAGMRLPVVDVLRGAAVAAMVVYHSVWDLGELRLIEADIRSIPAWIWFARAIAASFLGLVGVGLVLAHRRGIRPRAVLRRLATIGGAALLVTIGTYAVFPDAYVFFGILHCIACASVLALPFLRAPLAVVLVAAVLVLAAPSLARAPVFDEVAVFDEPVLAFLGLGTRVPVTNDYVPIFPWFGFVLCGILAMRLARPRLPEAPGPARHRPAILRGLAVAGRHSLLVYLLHQPILFGAMSAWAETIGRDPVAEAAPFLGRCEASCREGGESGPTCRATCQCAIGALKEADLWRHVLRDRATLEERRRIGALARTCFERSRGPRAD